jgi:hypothetical protein
MMLRAAVHAIVAIFLLCAIYTVTQDLAAWPMLLAAGLFVAGTVFERFYYRGSDALDGDWQPTSEKFLDEESGRPVTVWFNPKTGARRYVDADERSATR